MTNKKLSKSLKKYDKSKKNRDILISGELGITISNQKLVEVPNRKGFVYVRIKGNTSELIQAYNASVSPVYGLPVFVIRETGIYKVVGRNIDRYQNQFGEAPFLPKHGAQHSFNREIGTGGDVVWTYSQQFMPMLSYPSGSYGSMTLSVQPSFYEWNGQWKYSQNTGTPSYTPYLPTITGSARMVLSYIDGSDNSIKLVAGTPFNGSLTGSSQIAPFIPDIPRNVGIPLAAVRLVTGTTQIGWDAIYDMRDLTAQWMDTGTYTYVQDEGIQIGALRNGSTLNVTGDLSISVSGTVFNLGYVSSGGPGGGGGAGIMGWDEGVPLSTGTVLNVVGTGATLTASGTVLNLNVPGGGGWSLIQTVSLSNTGTITFSSIPQTYTQLRLVIHARTSAAATADTIHLRVGNGTPDSNNNYAYIMRADGSASSNTQSVTDNVVKCAVIPGNTAAVGYYGFCETIIDGYAEGHWKDIHARGGHTDNSAYRVTNSVGTWRSNQAIDTIFLLGNTSSSFVSGSYARLYGL